MCMKSITEGIEFCNGLREKTESGYYGFKFTPQLHVHFYFTHVVVQPPHLGTTEWDAGAFHCWRQVTLSTGRILPLKSSHPRLCTCASFHLVSSSHSFINVWRKQQHCVFLHASRAPMLQVLAEFPARHVPTCNNAAGAVDAAANLFSPLDTFSSALSAWSGTPSIACPAGCIMSASACVTFAVTKESRYSIGSSLRVGLDKKCFASILTTSRCHSRVVYAWRVQWSELRPRLALICVWQGHSCHPREAIDVSGTVSLKLAV
jgi:hypothetical protein